MLDIVFILFFCIISICLAIYFFTNYKNNHKLTYYKCGRLENNNPTNKVLSNNNYKRTDIISDKWDMYLPCGYTNVENELLDFNYFDKGKHIFAISGCDTLASKDKLWENLEKSYGRNITRTLMPESFLVEDTNDISLFKIFYSKHPDSIYILKKNIQDKKGLLLLTDLQDILETSYLHDYKVIQYYIKNPLLIKKHKINLRIYILVTCKQSEKHIYLYTNGKCIYTNQQYNPNTIENIESNITSVNLDTKLYNDLPENLDDLKQYLGDNLYIDIWNNIITKLKMIMKSIIKELCTNKKLDEYNSFQLFGGDIVLDENYNPYILEFNKGPDMSYKTNKDQIMKDKLFEDLFCLVNISECNDKKNWIQLI